MPARYGPSPECDGHPAVVALCHPIKGASRATCCREVAGRSSTSWMGILTLWSHSLGEVTELHWCGKIRGP